MKCPKCGTKMVCLFTSYQCDNCAGLSSRVSLPKGSKLPTATLQVLACNSVPAAWMLLQATRLTSVEFDDALEEFHRCLGGLRLPIILLPFEIWDRFLAEPTLTQKFSHRSDIQEVFKGFLGTYKFDREEIPVLTDGYFYPTEVFLDNLVITSLDTYVSNPGSNFSNVLSHWGPNCKVTYSASTNFKIEVRA